MASNPDHLPPPYDESNKGMQLTGPQIGQPAQHFAYTNPVSPHSTPYSPQYVQQSAGQPYGQPYGQPVAQPYGQQMVVQAGVNNYGVPHTNIQIGYVTQPQQPYVVQQPMDTSVVPETKKAKKLNLAAAILSVIVAVMFIGGIATDYWTTGPRFNVGLWRLCGARRSFSGVHSVECRPYSDASGGIIIPGVIFYAIGLILNLVVAFTKASNKRGMLTGAIVMYCLAVVSVVIAVGLYAVVFHPNFKRFSFTYDRGPSYHETILSGSFGLTCLLPFGALILAILAGMSCSEYASSVRVVVVGDVPAPVVVTANTRI